MSRLEKTMATLLIAVFMISIFSAVILVNAKKPDSDATVSLTVFVDPVIISISVDPTSIDFGTMVPGRSSEGKWVTITSASTVSIDLSVSVEEDDTFYTDNLGLGNAHVSNWGQIIFVGGDPLPVYMYLEVPDDATLGIHEGTLIFWATENPTGP